MDVTFVISAIIFTLLAVVVATSIFKGSSPAADLANARSYFRHRVDGVTGGLEQNGHVPEKKKTKKEVDDWTEISGSSHDHWDVVKTVLSEEAHPHPHTEEAAATEHSSTSSLSVPSCGSRHMSLETEGATESPGTNENMETNPNNSLKYVPGKARSHHLQMMMSKEELEEEQRVQREQLTAIFQLLKDNKETFGDMSEGDLEEQLRLYSI
ncbi:matrix-remodeling-associated protein 7-like isoform X6 [Melanotaenia boesemani]|uniref:matrix-remodeling-associated protein 7-like isoform X6 n=1 Tax=Melanotaenia boesemani TaxID=1250792 RepID=UPI001C0408CA|nr:matrix-remodeling-associated protein 7-like isoform X6 [Melanotaenia boesemani]